MTEEHTEMKKKKKSCQPLLGLGEISKNGLTDEGAPNVVATSRDNSVNPKNEILIDRKYVKEIEKARKKRLKGGLKKKKKKKTSNHLITEMSNGSVNGAIVTLENGTDKKLKKEERKRKKNQEASKQNISENLQQGDITQSKLLPSFIFVSLSLSREPTVTLPRRVANLYISLTHTHTSTR